MILFSVVLLLKRSLREILAMHFSEFAISSNAFLTSVRGVLFVADGSARAELNKNIIARLLLN